MAVTVAEIAGYADLDLAAVETDFRALAQPGVPAPEVGLLAVLGH
ncbi:hypothetical protein ABH926_000169 [Catenulispora sp. GP43]